VTVRVVTDTHTLLWYLQASPRLSSVAKTLLSAIEDAGDQIAISAITLAEVVYLIDRGRGRATTLVEISALIDGQATA
jgi:PIN domain nuclease of toxin-antitoxin system